MKKVSVPFFISILALCILGFYGSTCISTSTTISYTPVSDIGAMMAVPAGWFEMGQREVGETGYLDGLPRHFVQLDAYRIGKYEVTNSEYADVLNWAMGQGYLENCKDAINMALKDRLKNFPGCHS